MNRWTSTSSRRGGQPACPSASRVHAACVLYRLDQAKVILSLDCDFLGGRGGHPRLFADLRGAARVTKPADDPSRLYVGRGLMTLTGTNADHRLRVPTSEVMAVAARLAAAGARRGQRAGSRGPAAGSATVPLPAGVDPSGSAECAPDLLAHRGAVLVLAGHRQPLAVHLLAHALNQALGNVGKTVEMHPGRPSRGEPSPLEDLAATL